MPKPKACPRSRSTRAQIAKVRKRAIRINLLIKGQCAPCFDAGDLARRALDDLERAKKITSPLKGAACDNARARLKHSKEFLAKAEALLKKRGRHGQ